MGGNPASPVAAGDTGKELRSGADWDYAPAPESREIVTIQPEYGLFVDGDFVAPVRGRLEAALDELRAPALAADPNLERPLAKTREQVLRAIDLFADKAMPALARRDEAQSRRIEALRQTCLPGGKFQERVISTAYFRGKYGDRLAASFWEQLDLDPTRLSVILP